MRGFDTEEIIRMAREAGWGFNNSRDSEFLKAQLKFAELVATAERGAICALLDRLVNWYEDIDRQGSAEDIRKLIQHIRARGNDAA